MTTLLILASLVLNTFLVTPPSLPGEKADSRKFTKLASAPKSILPDPLALPANECTLDTIRISGNFGNTCTFSSGGCSPECNTCVIMACTLHCDCCIDSIFVTSDSGYCFYVCGKIAPTGPDWSR